MMLKDNNEPSLEEISDYNGEKNPEKKRIFWIVVAITLLIGAIYTYSYRTHNAVSDYVGTPEKPGINTAKTF